MLPKIQAFLASHHGYVVAAGLLGLSIYQLSTDDTISAGQSFLAALAALGLKSIIAANARPAK